MTNLAEAKELYTEAELAAVQAHIKRYFGDFQQSIKEYESPDICLEIAIIPPRPEHNYYTLATIGMGAHRMNVPEDEPELERAELLLNLPPDWLLMRRIFGRFVCCARWPGCRLWTTLGLIVGILYATTASLTRKARVCAAFCC